MEQPAQETVLSKYTNAGLMEIAGRFYRFSRLSMWDYFSTTELLDAVTRSGTPSASFLSSMLSFAPTPEEVVHLATAVIPGPAGEDGQPTTREVDLTEEQHERVIDQATDQKRNTFMLMLSPLLGMPAVKDQVVRWLADHLFHVPNPNAPLENNKKVDVKDFENPDIMPLEAIPTLARGIYFHPDIRAFFTKAKAMMKADRPS